MYFKHLLLAFKKYKWFYIPFLMLFVTTFMNFMDYEWYRFLIFNLDFEISDFIYHNMIIPLILSIIASIVFYIFIVFRDEYKKDLMAISFLVELINEFKNFEKDFKEDFLEKKALFEIMKYPNGSDMVCYDPEGFYRKKRRLTILLNHCSIVFRLIEDLLKLGISDAELIEVMKNIKHSKFMYDYEMIYKGIFDRNEILPYEKLGNYDSVGIEDGLMFTNSQEDNKKIYYRNYMKNIIALESQLSRLSYVTS